MGTPAKSALAQLCMDSATPFDGSSQPFEFISCGLKSTETHVASNGIRGERSRYEHRVRIAQESISGPIVMNPSVTELDFLWTYMLGGTTAAGVTDVADTLPTVQVMLDAVTKVFSFLDCRVASWELSGTQGQPLQLTLNMEGETESKGNAGTFPSLTIDTDNFFIFSDCTLTLGGAAREFASFTLRMDNFVDANRYMNSKTRAELPAQDREVTLSVDIPYTSDEEDLHDEAIAGAAGSLAVSDGSTTYTFDFGNCKIPAVGPDIPEKGNEIQMPLTVDCYKTGSSSECKVTKT